MYKSKVIETLKCFNATEIQTLEYFINSKLIVNEKESKNVTKLFNYLIKFYPNFSSPQIIKSKVQLKIYGQKETDQSKLNRLNGRLLKQIKNYIKTVNQNQSHYTLIKFKELELYQKKNNIKLINNELKVLNKSIDNNLLNEKRLFESYYFENIKSKYKLENNKRNDDLNLFNTIDTLDKFYYFKKFELVLQLLAHHNFALSLDIDDVVRDYQRLKSNFLASKFKFEPVLNIYIQSIEIFIEDDPAAFQKLFNILKKHGSELNKEQEVTLFTLARNFCVKQYSLGKDEFLAKAFQCYQNDLKYGRLYKNNKISASSLQAIVKLGLRMHKFDWVSKFLKEHKAKFNGESNVYNLNLAEYYFSVGKYDKCLSYLSYNYEDIHYKLSSKRLMLKCYYEQKSPIVDSTIQAFKLFIYRLEENKLTPIHKSGNNNFIDLLKQIILPSTYKNPKRINSLLSKINRLKIVADSAWLKEKLSELS